MGFPKWKYHSTKDALIVQDEEQEKALGSGWGESPAEFGRITYKEHMESWQAKEEIKEEVEAKPKKSKKVKAES